MKGWPHFYSDRFTPDPFLRVEYEGPGVARQMIPAAALFRPEAVGQPVLSDAEKPRTDPGHVFHLTLRRQELMKDAQGMLSWKTVDTPAHWRSDETVFIVMDMWNKHWCANGCQASRALLPRFGDVVRRARVCGVQIVHSPTEPAMGPYYSHPAYQHMATFPAVPPPPLRPHDEFPWPLNVADSGANGPIVEVGTEATGYAQLPEIEIVFDEHGAKDGICEPFEPVWNMMQGKGIQHVLVAGCATNMCVMNKPLGIRNLVRRGIDVALVRDLTRPMHNPASPPYVNLPEATRLTTEHIEKFWCPTISSEEIMNSTVDH